MLLCGCRFFIVFSKKVVKQPKFSDYDWNYVTLRSCSSVTGLKYLKLKVFLRILGAACVVAAYVMIPSCSTQQKFKRILAGEVDSVKLNLSKEESYIPEIKNNSQKSRDTLKIQDDSGKEILILKAVKDEETGEMVGQFTSFEEQNCVWHLQGELSFLY